MKTTTKTAGILEIFCLIKELSSQNLRSFLNKDSVEAGRCKCDHLPLLDGLPMQAGYPKLSSKACLFFEQSASVRFVDPARFFPHEEARHYLLRLCLLTNWRIADQSSP